MKIVCGRTGDEEYLYDEDDREEERYLFDASESRPAEPFHWTPALQDSFREELEKSVALAPFVRVSLTGSWHTGSLF